MVNYLKKILTSGLVAGMIIAPGCGDTNNIHIHNYNKDAKQESSDVRVDTQFNDGYRQADIQTEVIEDLFVAEDNLDLNAQDTNIDSNVEDLLTTEVSADLKDIYTAEVTDVEDTYEVKADVKDSYEVSDNTEVEDTYEINVDTNVEDAYEVNDVEDVFEINADVEDTYVAEVNDVEDIFEISADVEDIYLAEVNDVEDAYEVNADAEIENDAADSLVEQILSCENLNEVPACLGDDYATLVSTGLEVNTAIDLEYAGVTTDQDVDHFKMIVSGNPCVLPEYFEESCLAWINTEKPGISTVKLIDEENIEIRGGLLERIAALTVLANGEVQGSECVITGIDPNTASVNCNEQPEE